MAIETIKDIIKKLLAPNNTRNIIVIKKVNRTFNNELISLIFSISKTINKEFMLYSMPLVSKFIIEENKSP
ncbi:MAG: hypothetical protein Q4B52_07240 [Tissierellia bacterium]|nr:hypothetical protein [Tissierellia bacterium]